jgi:hypothetical protein
MAAGGDDNVIPLQYRDFEVAINAIASSIDDKEALKTSLQRFLASRDLISSLTYRELQRLLTLFPIRFSLSTPPPPPMEPLPPHPTELKAKAMAEQIGDKLDKFFADMSAAEDRAEDALKKAIKELGARAEDYAMFVSSRLVSLMLYIDTIESFFEGDNPFKYLSRFLSCGFYSSHLTYGVFTSNYSLDRQILSNFLRELKDHPSLAGNFGNVLSFYQKYATGLQHEVKSWDDFEKDSWTEIKELEVGSLFQQTLSLEMAAHLLDQEDPEEIGRFLGQIENRLNNAIRDGHVPTWDRILAATTPNYAFMSGDLEGIILAQSRIEDDLSDKVKALLKDIGSNNIVVGMFPFDRLTETYQSSTWEFPWRQVTEVPVLDVARCIAGTDDGCTNAELIDETLGHYHDPQYFRVCDALISVFLLHYLSQWTDWKIREASDYSPAAAVRMLLGHLARIPTEYRKFSSRAIAFVAHIAGIYTGPHQRIVRSFVADCVDHAPAIREHEWLPISEDRARQQLRELIGDALWEKLHSETISDLTEAEIAWLHIGKNLDTWPLAKPLRRRDCVHYLCCALERELRRAIRATFQQLKIQWFTVFKHDAPTIGDMRQIFLRDGSLAPTQKTAFEETQLCKSFSPNGATVLSEIMRIRNRAGHGGDLPNDEITPADVIKMRDLIFIKQVLAAAVGSS